MYKITNKTTGEITTCDAIEYINSDYIPTEKDSADGFYALVIETISPSEQRYISTAYAFEGHKLKGGEDTAEIAWEDEHDELAD